MPLSGYPESVHLRPATPADYATFVWARFEYVNFVAEDQPSLVAEMLAIGATVRMEIRHYRGSLAGAV